MGNTARTVTSQELQQAQQAAQALSQTAISVARIDVGKAVGANRGDLSGYEDVEINSPMSHVQMSTLEWRVAA